MILYRSRLIKLLFACLVLAISSCENPSNQPLRIGTNVWPGYETLYLARKLGFYQQTPIKLIEMTSASEVVRALRNGTLEGAALTLDEVFSIMDDGFKFKVILVMDFSNGGDALLAKPEFSSLEELRGKRIAVENSAVGAILLDGALDAANLTPADINIVPCNIDEHLRCYSEVDAVVTFDPFKTNILKQGAVELFNSSEIPNRIVDVLIVSPEVAIQHKNTLNQLLDGHFKALEYLTSEPNNAAKKMIDRMGLTESEILDSFNGLMLPKLKDNYDFLGGDKAKLNETTHYLAEFMLEKKLLKKQLNTDNLLDDSFLPVSKQ